MHLVTCIVYIAVAVCNCVLCKLVCIIEFAGCDIYVGARFILLQFCTTHVTILAYVKQSYMDTSPKGEPLWIVGTGFFHVSCHMSPTKEC